MQVPWSKSLIPPAELASFIDDFSSIEPNSYESIVALADTTSVVLGSLLSTVLGKSFIIYKEEEESNVAIPVGNLPSFVKQKIVLWTSSISCKNVESIFNLHTFLTSSGASVVCVATLSLDEDIVQSQQKQLHDLKLLRFSSERSSIPLNTAELYPDDFLRFIDFNEYAHVTQIESNCPGEDRYCIRIHSDIKGYAVVDGHGGHLAADITASILLDSIMSGILAIDEKLRSQEQILDVINSCFMQCDSTILDTATRLRSEMLDRTASSMFSNQVC